MLKKMLLLLVFFTVFCNIGNAQIVDFNVSNPYIWDTPFAMAGRYTNTNADQNILCHFFIYDLNGILKNRLTSEYVTPQGIYSNTPIPLKSPPFFRGTDYNAVVVCGTSLRSQRFTITQRGSLESNAYYDYSWILLPENVIPALIIIAVLIVAWIAYQVLRRS